MVETTVKRKVTLWRDWGQGIRCSNVDIQTKYTVL